MIKNSIFIYMMFISCNLFGIEYEEILISALSNSLTLQMKQTEIQIEQVNTNTIESKLYPTISVAYNNEYSQNLDSDTKNISVGTTSVNSNINYKNSLAFSLSYEMYNFGATQKQIESAQKGIKIKELEKKVEIEKLQENLLSYYLKALYAVEEATHYKEIRSVNKMIFEYKNRLWQSGMLSQIEVANEAIKLIELENKIQEANRQYSTNLIELSKVSHINLDVNTTILSPFRPRDEVVEHIKFENTYLGLLYKQKLAQKQDEKQAVQLSDLPTISMNSNYYYYGSDQDSASTSFKEIKENSWNIGFNLRWLMFDGFKYKNELKKLQLEEQKIVQEFEFAKREYEYEIISGTNTLEQLTNLLKTQIKNIDALDNIVISKNLLHKQGEIDTITQQQSKIDNLYAQLTYKRQLHECAYQKMLLQLKTNN